MKEASYAPLTRAYASQAVTRGEFALRFEAITVQVIAPKMKKWSPPRGGLLATKPKRRNSSPGSGLP